jgi:hygromycin-B 7''-O-kinase
MNFYAEDEWNLLVLQDDPPGWHSLGGDLAFWQPKVERACTRHGLTVEGEMTMQDFTNTVFFTNTLVVKVLARRVPVWLDRELESLQVLAAAPEANTPRLLGYGTSISDEDGEYPYLIMERLPGEPFFEHRNSLSIEEKSVLVQQVAERVRALHEVPIAGLKSFKKSQADWVRLIRSRAAQWEAGLTDEVPHLRQFPPYLKAQVPAFIAQNLPCVTEDFRPCLINADLNAWNILIKKQDGKWQVTGLIDFGYAEVGPIEYEWVSLCQKGLEGDETLMRAFFTAYGWQTPLPYAMKQRLKLYTLLHRFSALHVPPKETTEGPSLEAILDSQWPV